jgi:hypothetical protein
MSNFYIAGDYAGIESNGVSLYYGYEVTDENNEWCFVAKADGKSVTIPSSELGVRDTFECGECLIAGIAKLFKDNKIKLVLGETEQ